VRRVPAGPTVIRAAVCTIALLVNIGAHIGFASKYWRVVKIIVLSAFSDVVQAMEADSCESWSFESNLVGTRCAVEIYPHERNYTPEICEKAFKYFIALVLGRIRFGSLAIVDSVTRRQCIWSGSGALPSDFSERSSCSGTAYLSDNACDSLTRSRW
jgi:hypothetical protein